MRLLNSRGKPKVAPDAWALPTALECLHVWRYSHPLQVHVRAFIGLLSGDESRSGRVPSLATALLGLVQYAVRTRHCMERRLSVRTEQTFSYDGEENERRHYDGEVAR